MTPDERLRSHIANAALAAGWRDASASAAFGYPKVLFFQVDAFVSELAARGLAVVEVSKGEPSEDTDSPCSESVSRGDEPTREDGLRAAHPCSDVDGSTEIELNGQNSTSTLVHRIATLEAALRDAIHELTTRNSYWVCDKSAHEAEDGQPFHYRDDTTDAVKRLQEVLAA